MINDSNIETYIIEYLDGELDPDKVQDLLQAIEQTPRYAQMLEAYRGVYLSVDDEEWVFPDKKLLLKRQPRKMRLWIPVGLAAGIAAAVGVFLLMKPDRVSDQLAAPGSIAQNAAQRTSPTDTVTAAQTPSGAAHSAHNPGNHPYIVHHHNKKDKGDTPYKQAARQTEQADRDPHHATYASIEKIQVKTSPQSMAYNQVIQVSYVTVIKEAGPVSQPGNAGMPTGEDELEVKVAGVVLNQEVQQIKSIQDKFDKLKERFTDNLAQLSGISFTLSK